MEIQAIKKYMKDNHITYDELSKRSGLSISTIKKIFSGISQYPRIDTVQAIERALGLESPQWTEEERAQGVTDTVSRKLTAEEDDMLALYVEIGQKKGANAQAMARKILEQILNS